MSIVAQNNLSQTDGGKFTSGGAGGNEKLIRAEAEALTTISKIQATNHDVYEKTKQLIEVLDSKLIKQRGAQ